MVRLLFQHDSYTREFEATVQRVDGLKIFLDQTAFHPGPSGGLDTDKGFFELPDGERVEVLQAVEENNDVAHIVSENPGLKPGDRLRGIIDWERRYKMMRLHTASHVLLAVLYRLYGALVTGGHITPEGARDDFDLSGVEDWKKAVTDAVKEANRILKECKEVKVYWLPREDALKIRGIVKLADRLPPNVHEIRVVEIPGVDVQADGGPHVKNTCEVGYIVLQRLESKGARRKRAYYTLEL